MPKPAYTVDVADRLKELLSNTELNEESVLTYSYDQGYEKLEFKRRENYGGIQYAGVYHPNVVCEGRGTCIWCGCTL